MEIKSLKNGKKILSFFSFFSKLQQGLEKLHYFVLVKSYSISLVCLQHIMKTALLLRSLLITYLVTFCLKTEIFVLE